MSGFPTEEPLPSSWDWARVQVHPGTGLVDRRGDTLLVVPVLPASHRERVREVFELCHRPDLTGRARIDALRALLDLRPSAEMPGFALLVRTGHSLRAVVHGPVAILVDGRAPAQSGPGGRGRLAEHVLEDGAWHEVALAADGDTGDGDTALPDVPDVLSLDLARGTVPGAGVSLLRVAPGRPQQPHAVEAPAAPAPTGPATSTTALRPAMQFRTVLLGESAVQTSGGPPAGGPRRPPLPVAGAGAVSTGTAEPEILVEGVHCTEGHFTDPDRSTCPTCGAALSPHARRVRLPRPPLGILVTDGGTIYTVTGDFVIGREAEQAPDVLAGRARSLTLRDGARSTSRVHARLSVSGWKVLLSDNGSANGTFLSRHGAAGPWLPVTTHPPVPLVFGDRVRLGKRQLLFDTWRETVVPQVFR
jgi:hypothetical protein